MHCDALNSRVNDTATGMRLLILLQIWKGGKTCYYEVHPPPAAAAAEAAAPEALLAAAAAAAVFPPASTTSLRARLCQQCPVSPSLHSSQGFQARDAVQQPTCFATYKLVY